MRYKIGSGYTVTLDGEDDMALFRRFSMGFLALYMLLAGASGAAFAVDRFAVNVSNQGAFRLSLEIRDKVCGNTVLLRGQLEAGEARVIEICTNLKGFGALGATVGSGCSQVKRMEFLDIEPGDEITF